MRDLLRTVKLWDHRERFGCGLRFLSKRGDSLGVNAPPLLRGWFQERCGPDLASQGHLVVTVLGHWADFTGIRFGLASGLLAKRIVTTPFLNVASTEPASIPLGSGMLRWKLPKLRST